MTELGQSVDVRLRPPGRSRAFAFLGPAAMVSVGYMDPGNWATNLEGGARFGYQLLWVLVVANVLAVMLQGFAARLGIVSGLDLAEACRRHYSPTVTRLLWILCEIAIVACDLAEVLGSAIALNLLFGIPPAWGAAITGVDVLLILALQHFGVRRLEAVVAALVLTIGACMVFELVLTQPSWSAVASGLVPRIDGASLYVAIGILGATVMPHNLYLHSALVRTRRLAPGDAAKREAIRFNRVDTVISLNVALFVNVAILVLAAGLFHARGIEVTELPQAHELLAPMLGTTAASMAFAIALLAAGQSSTITGTLAGQVVMEGFVRLRMSPFKRRLLTRLLAIVPAVALLATVGESGVLGTLVASQVVLSLQLPFAIVPLVRFTSDRAVMGAFANPAWLRRVAAVATACIVGLNGWLVARTIGDVAASWVVVAAILGLAYAALLAWVTLVPLRRDATPHSSLLPDGAARCTLPVARSSAPDAEDPPCSTASS